MLDTRLKIHTNNKNIDYIPAQRINWDYVYYNIQTKYGTVAEYSINKLGRYDSYLSQCKQGRNNRVPVTVLEQLINDFELNQTALFPELTDLDDATKTLTTTAESVDFSVTDLESDFEKTVRRLLDDINTKLELALELEDKLNDIIADINEMKASMPKEDLSEKAVKVLKEMVAASGNGKACEHNKYMEELERRGVPKSYSRDAINRTGATVETVGYGKNKTVWLILPGEDG